MIKDLSKDEAADEVARMHNHAKWAGWRRRFRAAVASMNRIQEEMIQEGFDGANYYLAEDRLNLMLCQSHIGRDGQAVQEGVADSVWLQRSGGGDW